MRVSNKRDDKDRIRLGKCLSDNDMLGKGNDLRVVFFNEYFIVCSDEKFDSMVKRVASKYGMEDEAREILEARSTKYVTDNQGRFKVPEEYIEGAFLEKEFVGIGIRSHQNEKMNYVKVYPKTIYTKLAKDYTKKFEEILKGEGDEEGRRKN